MPSPGLMKQHELLDTGQCVLVLPGSLFLSRKCVLEQRYIKAMAFNESRRRNERQGPRCVLTNVFHLLSQKESKPRSQRHKFQIIFLEKDTYMCQHTTQTDQTECGRTTRTCLTFSQESLRKKADLAGGPGDTGKFVGCGSSACLYGIHHFYPLWISILAVTFKSTKYQSHITMRRFPSGLRWRHTCALEFCCSHWMTSVRIFPSLGYIIPVYKIKYLRAFLPRNQKKEFTLSG